MKTILFILLLSPLFSLAQTSKVYIRLTDQKGQLIKGESVTRGFESWILANTVNSSGKNNTQLNFSMNVSGASANLKRAMSNGEILTDGMVNVMVQNVSSGQLVNSYTIKMERISVLSCSEAMGCNNVMNTTVVLQAARIGWTYYSTGKTGVQLISRKFGWNAETNSEWTAF